MSTLYLVATPIGNLEDISARALRILGEVALIAAEDTRHTGKLLAHFKIKTRQTSYYDHNEKSKLGQVLDALANGDVALVSDAGSPGLNDPGYLLIRAALEAGHTVSPIPGPSAAIAALTVSGLPTDSSLYLGYLPRKANERRRAIQHVAELAYTLIWLESPHRLAAALADLASELPARQIAVAGELTKMYEQVFRGSVEEAVAHFERQPARGEYTLVLSGKIESDETWGEDEVLSAIQQHLNEGASPSSAARQIAKQSGWPRRKVYDRITNLHSQKATQEKSA